MNELREYELTPEQLKSLQIATGKYARAKELDMVLVPSPFIPRPVPEHYVNQAWSEICDELNIDVRSVCPIPGKELPYFQARLKKPGFFTRLFNRFKKG